MKNRLLKEIWSFITSLKLTIFILIIISVTSIFGTVIPQNEHPDYYLKYYEPSTYNLIKQLSLDNMYHAWWFITALSIFTLNLICCTLKRFPGFWRLITQKEKTPDDKFMQSLPLKKSFNLKKWSDQTRDELSSIVKKYIHKPLVQNISAGTCHMFAEKGKYARLSFYITHVGIVLIIVGALVGNFGYQGFMKLVEGETSDTMYLRGSSESKKLDFSIRCDDFDLTYYQGSRRPKDYKSRLTVIDGGKEVLSKVIEVNDPLQYKGVFFYQSSYGTASGAGELLIGVENLAEEEDVRKYKIKIGGRVKLDEKGHELMLLHFVPDFSIGANKQVISRSQELRNPAAQVALLKDKKLVEKKWIFSNHPDFHESKNSEYKFSFLAFFGKEYTGLQITWDPGVWVVWTGCFLLTLGSYLIFFSSHRRLWLKIEPKNDEYMVTVAGTSSKNQEQFGKVFEQLFQELKKTRQLRNI